MIIKTKTFEKWLKRINLTDSDLQNAVDEMKRGLYEASLGGNIYKKRVALSGGGKRGGSRTIVATNFKNRWFFVFGFKKNEKSTLNEAEEDAFKMLAKDLLSRTRKNILEAIEEGEMIEVKHEEKK